MESIFQKTRGFLKDHFYAAAAGVVLGGHLVKQAIRRKRPRSALANDLLGKVRKQSADRMATVFLVAAAVPGALLVSAGYGVYNLAVSAKAETVERAPARIP